MCTPELETQHRRAARRLGDDANGAGELRNAEVAHRADVSAIETVSDAEQGGQSHDPIATFCAGAPRARTVAGG